MWLFVRSERRRTGGEFRVPAETMMREALTVKGRVVRRSRGERKAASP